MDHREPVLSQGVQILAAAPPGSGLALQRLLRLLAAELPAASAELWLTHTDQTWLRLRSQGPARFSPLPANVAPPIQYRALTSPLLCESCWHLPLPLSGGLLLCPLATPPANPDAQQHRFSPLVSLLDLALRQYLDVSQRTGAHQAFLARLERTLQLDHENSTELLAAVGRQLLRYCRGTCVVLRGLTGAAVLGPPLILYPPTPDDAMSRCLEIESSLALTVLKAGRMRQRICPAPPRQRGAPRVFCLPLHSGTQPLGTLSIAICMAAHEPEQWSSFLQEVARQLSRALSRMTVIEQRDANAEQTGRKVQELTSLLHISRLLHGTLRINELSHFLLSAATLAECGGFARAALFMLNERSAALQGILGVTAAGAALVLPAAHELQGWDQPNLSSDVLQQQRRDPFAQLVQRQRIGLEERDHPLVRAVVRERIIVVPSDPDTPGGRHFAQTLELHAYACVPLLAGRQTLAVLVVGAPEAESGLGNGKLRFLEIFSRLAASALSNALLLRRLEQAYQELKETQERLLHGEKLAMLGEMAASIAHELKTPLIAVGGFARRLEKPQPAAKVAEYAGIISRETSRLESLLEGILTYARKPLLCLGDCDLATLVQDVLRYEADALQHAGITTRLELAPTLPSVPADAQKLRQVLLNLVTNACQAMPAGGTLTVRLYASQLRKQPALALEIEDSGGGIPEEHRPLLFTPFFSTKSGGTGLGLPIAARIVEQHNGQIEIFNRRQGAVFVVHFPLR